MVLLLTEHTGVSAADTRLNFITCRLNLIVSTSSDVGAAAGHSKWLQIEPFMDP